MSSCIILFKKVNVILKSQKPLQLQKENYCCHTEQLLLVFLSPKAFKIIKLRCSLCTYSGSRRIFQKRQMQNTQMKWMKNNRNNKKRRCNATKTRKRNESWKARKRERKERKEGVGGWNDVSGKRDQRTIIIGFVVSQMSAGERPPSS